MVAVVVDDEVLVLVVEDRRRPARELEHRVGEGRARQLQLDLLGVVAVDVAIAAGPDEIADVEVALLRQHVRQQRIARDVERHAEEDVGAALVELAAEPGAAGRGGGRDVELEEGMARQQRHLRQVGDVPGADDDPARIGIGLELLDDVGDLVDVAAVGRRPRAPLHAVDRAEVAVGARPLVPDRDVALLQPARVAVAAQEPEQLEDDRAQVHLLGRDEREAFAQVEAHLVAEDALRSGAGAVGLGDAVVADVAQEVLVLRADRALGGVERRRRGVGLHGSIMEAVKSLPAKRRTLRCSRSVLSDRTAAPPGARTARPPRSARRACRSRRSRRPRGRRCGRRAARSRGGAR